MGGYGIQAPGLNAHGGNIAADSDFPGTFGSDIGVARAGGIGYVLSKKA